MSKTLKSNNMHFVYEKKWTVTIFITLAERVLLGLGG